MESNHRFLGVGQESLPLDHGTAFTLLKAPGVGIEPTTSWFRARRHYQQQLPRSISRLDTVADVTARGEGFEPSSPASKAGGLPLADPQVNLQSALRESNSPVQLGRLAPLPLGQEHMKRKERESNPQGFRSTVFETAAIANWLALPFVSPAAAAGIEPATGRLTGACQYQHRPHRNRVGVVGFEPTISCSRSRRICQAIPYADSKSAQRESNPHFRHGKAVGCRYIMGAIWKIELSKNKEHRTGVEPALPPTMSTWCPGCGVLAAERPVPANVLSVGSEGLEPSPTWLRARHAATSTLIPSFVFRISRGVGAEGIGPSTLSL
jgi:hypothetical protein